MHCTKAGHLSVKNVHHKVIATYTTKNAPFKSPSTRHYGHLHRTVYARKTTKPIQSVATSSPDDLVTSRSHETDIVIIGSGIGGLCCAALLARYGYSVTICEAHYHAGGAAHGFQIQGFHFDAGPSFFAGLSGPPSHPTSNPLKQVLDAIGETPLPCVTYNKWILYQPDGSCHPCVCDGNEYAAFIRRVGGESAYREWKELESAMAPLQQGAALFPAAAIRSDPGILFTAARFGPSLLKTAFMVKDLTGPFSNIVDKHVKNPWLRSLMDLETFVLSGMLAKDTICAEMAFMFMERNSGKSTVDYPLGGSKSIVDALVRGIESHGGRVMLRCAVEEILVEGGRAVGVKLAGKLQMGDPSAQPEVIRARNAVVSNASVWDTCRLLSPSQAAQMTLQQPRTVAQPSSVHGAAVDAFIRESMPTPRTGSFMHLHLGINATGLPDDLECHHLVVNSWKDLEAPQNVCIASIPTVFDKNLAPDGKAVVHAYTAGNEPWEVWEKVEPGTKEYAELKKERTQCLWEALERCIPDIRERTVLQLEGSPHTHARFLRRYKYAVGYLCLCFEICDCIFWVVQKPVYIFFVQGNIWACY